MSAIWVSRPSALSSLRLKLLRPSRLDLAPPSQPLETLTEFRQQFRRPRRTLTTTRPEQQPSAVENKKATSRSSQSHSNPSYPPLNFSKLGASRAVRITVIASLLVLGTMETVFWTQTLWRYFTSTPPSPDASSSLSPQSESQESGR